MGAVHLSVLFAPHRSSSSLVAVLSSAADPGIPFGIPRHLLLLPQGFPFILQNLHRYFLYAGFILLFFLWRDAFRAFFFDGRFGIGLGTLVLLFNVILLTVYALSCHSLRHLAGGKLDCFSCTAFGRQRYTAWRWLGILNERHMLYAWISLITVGLTDLYIRMVASGAITDLRLL